MGPQRSLLCHREEAAGPTTPASAPQAVSPRSGRVERPERGADERSRPPTGELATPETTPATTAARHTSAASRCGQVS